MNYSYRALVKENIEFIGKDIDKLSQVFYRELFHLDISLKSVFSGNVVFLNRKFSNMLATFKNVTYLEKITASVEQMGERHLQKYGAQLEHFEPMQQALILALKDYYGDRFSLELEKAWNQVFQEVAEIMKIAMQKVDQRKLERSDLDSKGYDPMLLADVNGEAGIFKVHQRFYDVIFDDPWLGQFFYGKSKEALIEKQSKFMVATFGGENNYTGDTPAFVHMHMFITDEMHDYRQKILRQAIMDEGFDESVVTRWLKVDESFRESIVKNSVDECVMKCRGQIPVVVKKP